MRDTNALLRLGCSGTNITNDEVTVRCNDQTESKCGFDQVVLAVGMKPRSDLKAFL